MLVHLKIVTLKCPAKRLSFNRMEALHWRLSVGSSPFVSGVDDVGIVWKRIDHFIRPQRYFVNLSNLPNSDVQANDLHECSTSTMVLVDGHR